MNATLEIVIRVASEIVVSAGLLAIVIKGALQYLFAKELERLKTHLSIAQKLKADEQTQMLQKQRDAVIDLWKSVQKVIGATELVTTAETAASPSIQYTVAEADLIEAVKETVRLARMDSIYYPSAFDATLQMLKELDSDCHVGPISDLFKKVESSLASIIRKLYLEDLNMIMMK